MTELFRRGYQSDYLAQRIRTSIDWLERTPEDEVLRRSTEDLLDELVGRVQVAPLVIGREPIDGGVVEGTVSVPDDWGRGRMVKQTVFNLHAVYEFEGDEDLLYHQPSTSLAYTRIEAESAPERSLCGR
ncbi:hypothetical protein [Glaciibacter flavus]|uniref:hypothetical protein n=1 Tax=Orlajensenia flava TaxID=2565934 RepID=UPI003B0068B0